MTQIVIEIVAYKPSWADEFTTLAKVIREKLPEPAWRIDHIGSTAIIGLAAKDRIDIQVSVGSAEDFEEVGRGLSSLGYQEAVENRSDHIPPFGPFEIEEWEKRYFRPPADQRPTNLHVRVIGRANQRYALLFRDYVRRHPQVAAIYAQLKRRIAEYHTDTGSYCDIKDPSCDLILHSANIWARETKWKPGLSDQ
jgi:GrpB-like predicted nucleotidyltransferase (UPF0157 family)